ncbi:hypothetical protein V8E55_005329 [Tylopilus felleus]
MPPNLLQVGPLNEPLYYGSLYFAAVVSSAFYGVTCVQTYRNDPLRMKNFVTALWILNTTHEGLIVAGGLFLDVHSAKDASFILYYYAVYKYLMTGLLDPISMLDGTPELIVLVAAMTQGYFVYRIYLCALRIPDFFFLSSYSHSVSDKNIVVPFIWIVLAVVQLVYVCEALYSADGFVPFFPTAVAHTCFLSASSSVQAVALPVLSSNRFMSFATVCLALAAGGDVLVAIFLTFLLIHKRRATGYSSTAHVLQRLTAFAVNTGIWTTLFALLSVILLHVFPSNLLPTVFIIPLCPLYCNTLLANLNVRAYVRGEPTAHDAGGDLFTSATSPMSNIPKIDKHHGLEESNMVSPTHQQGVWKTTKVVTITDAIPSRPTTAECINFTSA